MKFMFRAFFLIMLLCAVLLNPKTNSDEPQVPEPGKQVLQSIEVPAFCKPWFDAPETRSEDVSATETMDFWLFLPKNETAKTDAGYPFILFLHGIGERAPNPNKVQKLGISQLLTKPGAQEKCPFIVVSPQCQKNRVWSAKQLEVLVEKLIDKYPVDKKRVYVTGLSMGGFGTWSLITERPDLFAAAMPVCGGGDPKSAKKLVDLPIWAFHGDSDPLVKPVSTESMVQAIKDAGGTKIRSTFYIGVAHESWEPTYCNPHIYEWLLEQKKD